MKTLLLISSILALAAMIAAPIIYGVAGFVVLPIAFFIFLIVGLIWLISAFDDQINDK